LLFTLVNLEVEDQKLPLNLGPLAYVAFTGNDLDASVGAITRLEYDFNFPLNLYFQAGMVVNIGQDSLFSWPFALGARYIF
jgi:hypothetical protein